MEGSLLGGEVDEAVAADRETLTQKNIEWIRTEDDVRPRGESVIVSGTGENVSALSLFEEAEQEAIDEEAREQPRVAMVFVAFCLLEVTANFDAGVLPACVGEVMVEFDLDYGVAGLLGSLVYVGMVVGTPVAGYYLTNTTSQNVLLSAAALLNTVAILTFAFASNTTWLFIGRTLMGVSQGAIFVYAPVWVDEFSPIESAGVWMAGLQGAVVLGIVSGYVTTGIFVTEWLPMTCPEEDRDLIDAGIIDIDRASVEVSALTKEQRIELAEHGKNFSAVSGSDFDTEEDFGCYNPRWKFALIIQAGCMATFIVIFLLIPTRWVNAKGGLAERLRDRRNVLYRAMIAALKPQNIDKVAQLELQKQLTPSKVLGKMKHSVAASTLVTTTREAYQQSYLHDHSDKIAAVAHGRDPRRSSAAPPPKEGDELELGGVSNGDGPGVDDGSAEASEGVGTHAGVATDNTNRVVRE